MSRERGILGLKKDPKHQLLFLFKVPEGEEWPSSDSEDDDYRPDAKPESDGSADSEDERFLTTNTSSTKSRASTSKAAKLNSNNNAKTRRGQERLNKRKHDHSQAESSQAKKQRKHSTTLPKHASGSHSERTPAENRRSDIGDGKSDVTALTTPGAPVPHLPPELWMRIFSFLVGSSGPLPFLCRASKVCQSWREMASHPTLWHKVDLSYGWIKSTDQTLQWLAQHRLSQCREISLSGWKNVTNNAVKELSEHCPQLESVNVSHCAKLTSVAVSALADNCHSLRELDLSFIPSDGVSTQTLKKIAEQLGATLTSLNVAGNNLKGFHLALNSIMEHCTHLEMLDISNSKFSTDFLMLNVEKLHVCCPSLRILRLANCKVRGTQVSQRVQDESPGFTKLTQLSCAMPAGDSPMTGGGVPDNLLQRLVHKAGDLRLLDLRGCSSFHPDTLLASPAINLTQLYLSQSSITRYSDSLEAIALKWRHSLKVLDLAWTSPVSDHLDNAITALTQFAACPLEQLNLAGTTVTLQSVKLCLQKLGQLTSLDLTSCRALPRGIKCLHQGRAALNKLHKTIK
ncbi:hypothetical protein BaRGS_00006220 [Batillaria attramentaria]|uniref:F-box domain-containing protein n=1 Tax=Batillaria attramentaria TaxID=370345 RepID=A0ABD0LSZ4_9CAEN